MAEDAPVCVMLLDGKRVDLYLLDAARLMLWIAEHQDDLRGKGSWQIDHAPGRICVTRTTKEQIA